MALDFHYCFGLRNSRRSVAFYKDNTVMFAAGRLCVLHDLDSGVQTRIECADGAEISALVRCGILIAGAVRGRPPSVCIFNTLTDTQKFYSGPASMESEEFTCLSVSVNLRFVVAQGGAPDWLLVVWLSQTREIVATFSPAAKPEASVLDVSFHEGGRDEFVVVGGNVFKLYEYREESLFEETVFEKFEKSGTYHTVGWPEKQNLVVGSSEGQLLFFRGIELVHEIDLREDAERAILPDGLETDGSDRAATSVVVTPQRLVCIFAGIAVLIYDGEEISFYTLTRWVVLSPDRPTRKIPGQSNETLDRLWSVVVGLDDRDLIATTRDGQLLRCPDFAGGGAGSRRFATVFPRQHDDPVVAMDVSRGRPLIASCSRRAVCLWNYSDKNCESMTTFGDEINSVAIHPTGLYVALAFERYFRTFGILYHELRDRDHIPCKNCSRIGFSTAGHLLAVVSESVVEIYSFVASARLFKLEGHAGSVTSFDWIEHDSRLVSCDDRGVVCEWDLVSAKKIWENTAVLSYSCVSANRTGNAIVSGSDRKVRCFDGPSTKWILECGRKVARAVYCPDDRSFYVGTSDGCVLFYDYPASEERVAVSAHSGTVSGLKFDSGCDLLVTSGSDGCVFLWKPAEGGTDDLAGGIFRDLCLVDKSILSDQREKSKQFLLSLRHADIAYDCDFELACRKHQKVLRTLSANHERKVEELNARVVKTKEEMQTDLFDSDPKSDLEELEVAVRHEIIDTTLKLNEACKKCDSYADETNEIVLSYQKEIDALVGNDDESTWTLNDAIRRIEDRVRAAQNALRSEKKVGVAMLSACQEYQKESEREVLTEANNLTDSESARMRMEGAKSYELRTEVQNLKQLTELEAEDNGRRRNVVAGQVDFDVAEKIRAITLLKKDFLKLESVLDSKEKNCLKQEKKFCEMRKSVGSIKKYQSVSHTTVGELLNDIATKQSQIESRRESIEEVRQAVPRLEAEIEVVRDLCSTVTIKVSETVGGYHRKQKVLRDTQDVISKYTALLHKSAKKECDPVRLKEDVLRLFEDNELGSVDEDVESRLLNEFESQVDKLKDAYDRIKEDPSKVQRDKSIVEFRLSQENSKILKAVHKTQKETEKLRSTIGEMETGLGLQVIQVKSNKLADELRNKIDFVLEANRRNKAERMREIARLDVFIEEQQKEIERFQAMAADPSRR